MNDVLSDWFRPGLRFVAVGHVTNDHLTSGLAAGGSAFYATLAARALGAEATAVTCFGEDWVGLPRLERAGVQVIRGRSASTSCFENLYRDGRRFDRVLAKAEPVRPRSLPEADVVLACPVIGEVELSSLPRAPGAVIGAGLQGWLRTTDADGTVRPRALDSAAAFRGCRVVFLSDQDLGTELDATIAELRRNVPIVALTRGARGSTVFEGDAVAEIPAAPAHEVDPTGAGDVYATAFLLALASGKSPVRSAELASCAAACVVEAPGADAIEDLSAFPARWARYVSQEER